MIDFTFIRVKIKFRGMLVYIFDFDMFGAFESIHFALVTDSNLRFEFIARDFDN
jgi:hypothetical protein